MRSEIALEKLSELSPELYEIISKIIRNLEQEIDALELELDLAGSRKTRRRKFDDEV